MPNQDHPNPDKTPREILRENPGPLPWWFSSDAGELEAMSLQELLKDCSYAYYPGAGTDGECFHTVTGACATAVVVYADYYTEPVRDIIPRIYWHGNRRSGVRGYTPAWHKFYYAKDLPWLGQAMHVGFSRTPDPEEVKGALFLLQRDKGLGDDHGIEKILFLNLKADGYGVVTPLFDFCGARPFLVVIQDHAWGGNYDKRGFAGYSRLYEDCEWSGLLPDWLLGQGPPWPGYSVCSALGEPSGMNDFRRELCRRDNTGNIPEWHDFPRTAPPRPS
jgi:hypothetical protein